LLATWGVGVCLPTAWGGRGTYVAALLVGGGEGGGTTKKLSRLGKFKAKKKPPSGGPASP